MSVKNGDTKDPVPPIREESPTGESSGGRRHQAPEKNASKDDDDAGDQGSTQSSAGDSSDLPAAKVAVAPQGDPPASGRIVAAMQDPTEYLRGSMTKSKNEGSVSDSEDRTVLERGLFRKESSRKSVRILEPSAESFGRWSSNRSLDMGESNEQFIIDTGGTVVESEERRIQLYAREDSDDSFTHRSFIHDLSEVPTEASWNKNYAAIIYLESQNYLRKGCGECVFAIGYHWFDCHRCNFYGNCNL